LASGCGHRMLLATVGHELARHAGLSSFGRAQPKRLLDGPHPRRHVPADRLPSTPRPPGRLSAARLLCPRDRPPHPGGHRPQLPPRPRPTRRPAPCEPDRV
jgi:hypothetical protein